MEFVTDAVKDAEYHDQKTDAPGLKTVSQKGIESIQGGCGKKAVGQKMGNLIGTVKGGHRQSVAWLLREQENDSHHADKREGAGKGFHVKKELPARRQPSTIQVQFIRQRSESSGFRFFFLDMDLFKHLLRKLASDLGDRLCDAVAGVIGIACAFLALVIFHLEELVLN